MNRHTIVFVAALAVATLIVLPLSALNAEAKRKRPATVVNPPTTAEVLTASELHWLTLCPSGEWAPLGDGSEVCINCDFIDEYGAPNCVTTVRRVP